MAEPFFAVRTLFQNETSARRKNHKIFRNCILVFFGRGGRAAPAAPGTAGKNLPARRSRLCHSRLCL